MATISSSETFTKQHAFFLSIRKTVNIQGYSKLWEPLKTQKLLSTDLVNTKVIHPVDSAIHPFNYWGQKIVRLQGSYVVKPITNG